MSNEKIYGKWSYELLKHHQISAKNTFAKVKSLFAMPQLSPVVA